MPGKGRPWPPGTSGNPSGKPHGAHSKFTAQFEDLLDKHGGIVLQRVFHSAIKGGDMRAAKMVVERIIPPVKDRPISFLLPNIETTADLPKATAALLRGVAEGLITPSEAADLSKLVDAHMTALREVDHAARLAEIEEHPSISNGDKEKT